ncbi:MAG: cyclopropane-fatty-acyl-phospholipid synthase family protein [Leptospiraceae bacterium]|nr:cyclopropane-fatty-acyl-phospholipid synthase family protein [Leptospiraceae bacterium]MDW7975697.1 cyclopropane-fatty-acyl-phospholipid synthase family protein [Leptospiraceae bacterium]
MNLLKTMVQNEYKIIEPKTISQKFFYHTLKYAKNGELHVVLNDNERFVFGEKNEKEPAFLFVKNPNFFRRVLWFGDIGFAEAYMNGEFETNDLYRLLEWFLDNADSIPIFVLSNAKNSLINIFEIFNFVLHKFRKNTLKKSKENIAYHYDLSNEFYQLMLDETLTYSSGIYFPNDTKNLTSAQISKYEKICRKLNLKPYMHILEIGSGWGGFAKYVAENYHCYVDTITISEKQYMFVKELIERNSLSDRIRVYFLDYRLLDPKKFGLYDRVVSIEMAEAVGYEYFPEYFKTIEKMLKSDGLALIQYINYPEYAYKKYLKTTDFIQKYIFPGGQLLSHYEVLKALQETKLCMYDLESFGLSYAETLKSWRNNFLNNLEKIKALGFDDKFIRMWLYYLIYCEVGFRKRYVNVSQILLSRPMNKDLIDGVYF